MNRPLRLGAVGYLNARPLVFGLAREADRFAVRFDVPSTCAALLHDGAIDLGLVPSIEYCRRPGYAIVPGASVASRGPVDSVALYTRVPVERITSIALDSSSRTSAGLLRVLCARKFGIAPSFEPMAPAIDAMLGRHPAFLLIGDPALFLDHRALGLEKIDLGEQWTAMTGLPFVWAFWVGRAGAVEPADVARLQQARREGQASLATIAAEHAPDDRVRQERIVRYLRENIHYDLDGDYARGLARYLALAGELGLAPAGIAIEFFGMERPAHEASR